MRQRGRKDSTGMLISQLSLWATEAQSCWDLLKNHGESTSEVIHRKMEAVAFNH